MVTGVRITEGQVFSTSQFICFLSDHPESLRICLTVNNSLFPLYNSSPGYGLFLPVSKVYIEVESTAI